MEALAKAVLVALAEECGYSFHAHVPEGQVLRHFRSDLRGDARKELKELVKQGFAQRHPTGRNTTYNITRTGLTEAQR